MPLFALRPLPVNDSHDGPLMIRMETRSSGSVYVYVRREADKKTWLCKVQSLQEILAPSQLARQLDVVAVLTCLYHGFAYDDLGSTSSYATLPVELQRKEVAFSQPETWIDDAYRLTMRVSVRSSAVALSDTHSGELSDVAEAIPVVDVADEDVVFGLHFKPTTVDVAHKPPKKLEVDRRTACLRVTGIAFAISFLNWEHYKNRDFLRTAPDGVHVIGFNFLTHNVIEVTLDILHAKRSALWLLSVNSSAVQPVHTITYQTAPGGDLHHTIAQYLLRMPLKAWLQVALLPGSAAALEGSSLTVREIVTSQ